MAICKLRIGAIIIAACVAGWIITGCSDKKVTEPENEQILNPDKPNANSQILSQTAFGDPGTWNTIWELKPDGSGAYYFRGGHNSRYSVGCLTATGSPLWSTRTVYWPRGIHTLPPSAVIPNGLVAVGAHDIDSDGKSDVGYVSLFASGGSLLSQAVYASDTSDVWLNSIAPISDSTFVVVGGERAPSGTRPFVATIALTAPGQLEKRHQTAINAIPNRYFGCVVTNPSELVGSELSFYVLSREDLDSGIGTGAAHKISAILPTLIPYTVEWNRDILAGTGLGTRLRYLCFFEDNLYLAGDTEDAAKEPRPSEGGYWNSGVAASLTLTGELRWLTSVALTGHSERFYGIVTTPDALYAIGQSASFSQSNQVFGYGWISKIEPNIGEVVSNMTFGEDSYGSGFNSAVISGSAMHCGGWTLRELGGEGYSAWFCEIDIGSSSLASYLSSPVPAQIVDNNSAEHWPGDSQR